VRGVSRSDGFVRQFRESIFNNELRARSPVLGDHGCVDGLVRKG
jgi:hypothetical protein